jgi:hypothetical protein
MSLLKFPIDGVRRIYEHSKDKKEFNPSFGDFFEHRFLKPGVTVEEGQPAKVDDIDFTKVPPRFELVHDQGVYLMAGTRESLLREGEEVTEDSTPNFVVYAEGMNPDIDEAWYEEARHAVGGDDFGQPLPLEWMKQYLENFPKAKYFCLSFNDESIGLVPPSDEDLEA